MNVAKKQYFKWRGKVVECVARYDFKDACRVRPLNVDHLEVITSFSELKPHRTLAMWKAELKAAREQKHQALLDDVLETVRKNGDTIGCIAHFLNRPTRQVSKACAELQRAGKIKGMWTSRPFKISVV